MNLEQIVRKARFEVDAIRADASTSQLWTTEEVRDAVNTAMDRAARIIRLTDSDLLTKTIKSTDDAEDLISENYDPVVLTITADTADYTLPPDLVSIVSILPIVTSQNDEFDGVEFMPAKSSQRLYRDQRVIAGDSLHTVRGGVMTYLYTQLGTRTLRVAPTPKDTFDIEIVYRYRPPRLLTYDTFGAGMTTGLTAVTGIGGTTWITSGVRTPAQLIDDMTDIDLNIIYQDVASIDSNTALTLSRDWLGATFGNNTDYGLSMVPLLPQEHHQWLASMTAAIMLRKVNLDVSAKAIAALEAELIAEIQPEVTMRQVQESLPVEPFSPSS